MKSVYNLILTLLLILSAGTWAEAWDPGDPPFPLGLEADHWCSIDCRVQLKFRVDLNDRNASFVIRSRGLDQDMFWGNVERSKVRNFFVGDAFSSKGDVWSVVIHAPEKGSLTIFLSQGESRAAWIMKPALPPL